MDLTFIISPIVGSVIGYCTNWVAVKMLFKPLTEKRVLGIKVPFTPGVIPRRREKIAESIGDAVGQELLTADAFQQILEGKEMKGKLRNFVHDRLASLAEEERSLEQLLELITTNQDISLEIKEELTTGIKDLLSSQQIISLLSSSLNQIDGQQLKKYFNSEEHQQFKEQLSRKLAVKLDQPKTKEQLVEFLAAYQDKLTDSQQTIADCLPSGVKENLKQWLREESPELVEELVDFLDSQSTKERINQKLDEVLGNNSLMQIVGGFLDKDKLVDQFIGYLVNFLTEPASQEEILERIDKFVDILLATDLAVVVDQFDKQDLREIVDFLMAEVVTSDVVKELLTSSEQKLIDRFEQDELITADEFVVIEELIEQIINSNILTATLSNLIDYLMQRPVKSYFTALDQSLVQKLEQLISTTVEYLLEFHLGRVLSTLNFKDLVVKKVNDFDILEVENLLLSVIETELRAITWFGAVLGLIMGIITPVISVVVGS
ncbi:MAG: DUF445 family protein [Bacillota bacterium]